MTPCIASSSATAVVKPRLCFSAFSAKLPRAAAPSSVDTHPILRFKNPCIRASSAAQRVILCKSQTNPSNSVSVAGAGDVVQEMSVYEINEGDRGSPAYLALSHKDVSSLGDLAPFTNNVYTGDLKKRAGISAGICVFIKKEVEKGGDRYEAIYSYYLGDYGHISVQGPYLTYQQTFLAVKGGSGVFAGASGEARLNQISPKAGLITFYLKDIPQLPPELLGDVVPPSPRVEAAAAAKACAAGATLPNFTT